MNLKTLIFLDHFIAEGKYPIMVNKSDADFVKKELKFLTVKKLKKDEKFTEIDFKTKEKSYRNYQVSLKKEVPSLVVANYWKFKFDELQDEHNKLCDGLNNLVNQ